MGPWWIQIFAWLYVSIPFMWVAIIIMDFINAIKGGKQVPKKKQSTRSKKRKETVDYIVDDDGNMIWFIDED